VGRVDWSSLIIGVLIGFIAFGLPFQYLREKALSMTGDNSGSEKIFGKWYVIVPEEKYIDLLTKGLSK
jgi:hypothetical protein